MATTESKFENLKLTESTQKGKGEMLQAHKSRKDGKLHQSGEDSVDSAPSNKTQVAPGLKGMVRILPTQEVLPMKQEKRDEKFHQPGKDSFDAAPSNRAPIVPDSTESVMFTQEVQPVNEQRDGKLHQPGEDSSDAAPSDRAPAVPDSKESIMFTQEVQPENTERDEDVEMREPGDSTDAMPFSRPAAPVQQPNLLVPGAKQKTRTRPCPSAVPGPGARCEDGIRLGAQGTTVEQAINLEEEKDLLLYEIAEKVAGVCDLRKMALRLRITESEVARMEHEFPRLVTQFYKVFQIYSQRVPNASEMFKRLLEVLVKTDQESAAVWLRKRLGIKEPVASLEGEESSPIADVIPQREARRGSGNNEFYDIFLMHSGKSDSTKKFQNICKRHNWTVKTSDTMPAADPVHDAIEKILVTSTHLALIITENDCIKYRNHEMSMTVEMALQLAYTHGELSGRVLPIRCCQKRSLPLVLQALTGAHIDEDSFEERLVETIDTSKRLARMRENQD